VRAAFCIVVLLLMPGLKGPGYATRGARLSGTPVIAQIAIRPYEDSDPRTVRLALWLKAILNHTPGEFDRAAESIARLGQSELQALSFDTAAFVMLMRDPRLSYFAVRRPRDRVTRQVQFTPRQLERLRTLGCAASGTIHERYCMQRRALAQLDEDLRRLGEAVAVARRRGEENFVLKRAAMLHADVAMLSGGQVFDHDLSRDAGGSRRITISVDDGRETATFFGVLHWEIGRALVAEILPRPDATVRQWYHATSAWMQARGYHENTDHLWEALRLFPDDAELRFLSGCEHESFARSSIQAAVRSVRLPPGFTLAVQSAAAELGDAEDQFRKALEARPSHVEARLRLGRVLLLRGRASQAVEELRRAYAAADEDPITYYAAMFLGAAEEAVGNFDEADRFYSAASALYPNAQSPHIAQSALGRRRGDRTAALAAIDRVFQLAAAYPEGQDPWWTYDLAAGRHAETLLDALRVMIPGVEP
jgi:tetratricopeptide (TPR) repeat protein